MIYIYSLKSSIHIQLTLLMHVHAPISYGWNVIHELWNKNRAFCVFFHSKSGEKAK